ncbi:glycoside hydrolase family 18 protein [Streptomyces antarcticus]|uniref:glycoside hydrolase family 18 protein n=1 Tax=Streptomyces antarcticus TaxID=2996458 RepID=UPI00227170CB|nr:MULTISPECIES: glycoside hydrolase family 18 protein [unclassified Streptomyces]MCY0947311.1 glycoside hydrolase family 18 protein [Streptomyces sp. H34-AA3]MCZ4084683.1 glycoside hydrolase family 18 protein [Streptomyces sp. H34-S5]
MRRSMLGRLAVAACSLSLLTAFAPSADAQGDGANGHHRSYKKVGYFTQWGIYGRDFQVQDLDANGSAGKLTHINYAFGNVSADGKCFTGNVPGEADAWADYSRPLDAANSVDGVADTWDQPLAGNFNQLRELKAKHPGLKALISLGGWSWSTHFSDAALTPASRKALVTSCIDLYIKGNLPQDGTRGGAGAAAGVFDGIDLDWEWPGSAGDADTKFRPEDKANFTALVKEFRTQLDALATSQKRKSKYELTAYVPTATAKIDAGFDVRRIMRDFDFVNLQGYDFHVSGEATTAQQSALRARNDFSVDGTVEAWKRRGAPAHKLVVGMPFYGQGWTGVSGGGDGMGQPATGPAPATWAAGYEDYKELKKLADSGSYQVHRDRRGGHAWLFDGTTLWTYDDPQVLRAKTAYVREEGLGGAMFWSLDADTADGELITAVDRGLRGR